jgi:hypothetical protein
MRVNETRKRGGVKGGRVHRYRHQDESDFGSNVYMRRSMFHLLEGRKFAEKDGEAVKSALQTARITRRIREYG